MVSAMAYEDLNPARASMADSLAESDHTSVQCRFRERAQASIKDRNHLLGRPLKPVAGLDAKALLGMSESSYLELVQWTGEQAHATKRGKLATTGVDRSDQPPEILWTLAKHPQQWLRQVKGTERHYYRAIGSAEALMAKAKALGQCWMKGVSADKAWLILRTQVE